MRGRARRREARPAPEQLRTRAHQRRAAAAAPQAQVGRWSASPSWSPAAGPDARAARPRELITALAGQRQGEAGAPAVRWLTAPARVPGASRREPRPGRSSRSSTTRSSSARCSPAAPRRRRRRVATITVVRSAAASPTSRGAHVRRFERATSADPTAASARLLIRPQVSRRTRGIGVAATPGGARRSPWTLPPQHNSPTICKQPRQRERLGDDRRGDRRPLGGPSPPAPRRPRRGSGQRRSAAETPRDTEPFHTASSGRARIRDGGAPPARSCVSASSRARGGDAGALVLEHLGEQRADVVVVVDDQDRVSLCLTMPCPRSSAIPRDFATPRCEASRHSAEERVCLMVARAPISSRCSTFRSLTRDAAGCARRTPEPAQYRLVPCISCARAGLAPPKPASSTPARS